jgi:hypothetical protein
MNRPDHARVICRKVTARISRDAPKGLGHWPRVWDVVEEASDAFLDALDRWVEEDSPETREAVETATSVLLVAWKDAGELYVAATGSPPPEVAGAV